MQEESGMSEDLHQILELHRDRGHFTSRLLEQVKDLNQDASALILAWELSGLVPDLDPTLRERLFALCLSLQVAHGLGHTRISLQPDAGSPISLVFTAMGLEAPELKAILGDSRLAPIVGQPGESKPLIVSGDWLYSHRLFSHEQALAKQILTLRPVCIPEPIAPSEGIFNDPVSLNDEQRRGVTMALTRALTLITGGPGTGKTSIVISILRALLHQDGMALEDIALAAPTGKAAQRMGEAIRNYLGRIKDIGKVERGLLEATLEPKTLHRQLGWHPAADRFRHGPGSPIAAKVVIVDEASMISQEHMCRLLGALAPNARLILLGDANQLPSVEAGCAFRDMVTSLGGNCIELLQSYRMNEDDPDGRNILSVARAIKDHKEEELWSGPEPIQCRGSLDQLQYHKVELLDPADGVIQAFLERWFGAEVTGLPGFQQKVGKVFTYAESAWGTGDEAQLKELFDHFDQFRILCALREAKDFRGVEKINEHLHRKMLSLTGEGLRNLATYCAGEPVLMTANDYRRGIFNGDQGLILKVRFDGQIRQAAVFPRLKGFVPFPLDPLKHQLEHAYAMTVHKSQGSEYSRIAIVLPQTNHKALTRELLYTGLTRAKRSVVLLAERERIPFASGNPSLRDSGLATEINGIN
jgi:exodeoxyribonuclease V alpha subunit